MPDGRPKAIGAARGHRTKAEKALRQAAEEDMRTEARICPGPMLEKDREAAAYYRRVTALLEEVGLNEAFYENVITRYCLLLAEVDRLTAERLAAAEDEARLRAEGANMPILDFIRALERLTSIADAKDKTIAKKRDQLLAIEKENLMTVQGKLRAIPKQPEKGPPTGLGALLAGRDSP